MENGARKKKGQEEKGYREGEERRRKGEQRISHHNVHRGAAWSWCAGVKRAKILEPA